MSRHRCYIAEPAPTQADTAAYWHERNYYHPQTREVVTWGQLPPGALVEHAYEGGRPGPDGKMWILKCPDGYPWEMNGPAARTGTFWTITGNAPDFTARPSIHVSVTHPRKYDQPELGDVTRTLYHGWLNSGWLESTADSPC